MIRTLQELIDTNDPGWPILEEWIGEAANKIEILPVDKKRGEEVLLYTQITTRSLMGALAYETGGLLIDDGWIRIFGSGCERMQRSLISWNRGKTFTEYGEIPPYLLIADDAIGGHYALNGGFFGKDLGKIYYNLADSLNWEPMDMEYSQFLLFCFETDMDDFYQGMRWKNWHSDVSQLNPDYSYSLFPFLWTKEGRDIEKVSRKVVSAEELYESMMNIKSAKR